LPLVLVSRVILFLLSSSMDKKAAVGMERTKASSKRPLKEPLAEVAREVARANRKREDGINEKNIPARRDLENWILQLPAESVQVEIEHHHA